MPRRFALAAALLATIGTPSATFSQEVTPRVADIDWSGTDLVGVSGSHRERIADADATLLPILIPADFFKYKSLTFVGQPLEYSASVLLEGVAVSIFGTRIAMDIGADADLAASSLRVALSEEGASASVERYGAAYTITVECKKRSDPRCASEQYVRDLVSGLELVGGGKGAPTASPSIPPGSDLIAVSGDPAFRADPPGQLLDGSGNGVRSDRIYAPNIRFPIKDKPAYLNSQVYGYGGFSGPTSRYGWADDRNYQYPWKDNFCEKRSRRTPACPGGTGHQGVDIRPATKHRAKYMAVAVESGRIVKVGVYSVTLAGNSGNHYNYLHLQMNQLKVRLGQQVTAGQDIGFVSDNFGGTSTTVHLHFEITQNVNGKGWRHVPPYASLVAAYKGQ